MKNSMHVLYSTLFLTESHSFLKIINSVIIVITKGSIKELYFPHKGVSCRHFYPQFGSVHSEHHTNGLLLLLLLLLLLYKVVYL
jgi:hypothetical protein